MPELLAYTCTACDFSLPCSWSGGMYAIDAQGHRVRCLHPGEFETAAEVLGLSFDELSRALQRESVEPTTVAPTAEQERAREQAALVATRFGFTVECYCFNCGVQAEVDSQPGRRACPSCGSADFSYGR